MLRGGLRLFFFKLRETKFPLGVSLPHPDILYYLKVRIGRRRLDREEVSQFEEGALHPNAKLPHRVVRTGHLFWSSKAKGVVPGDIHRNTTAVIRNAEL